jgi:lysophospholipid acyltransferase (LPLAT)-like uncharacterized protein
MSGRAARLAGDLATRQGHRLLRLLGATWRIRHAGAEHVRRARAVRGSVIYVFTHGVILPLAYAHRGRGAHVLISESRDGEIIARITERLGFRSVRGSSSELVRLARDGRNLAITPVGPKGPRGSVAPGTVLVAARSEVPIVPVGVAADRAWRARSWDRFLVPKPWARVAIAYGPPLSFAPTDLDNDASARIVEQAMADVEHRADELSRTGFTGVDFVKEAP